MNTKNKKLFSKYYKNFFHYGDDWLDQNENAYSEIYNIMRTDTKLKILDIGSGCGSESICFAKNGHDVTSVDVKKDRIDVARFRASQLLTEHDCLKFNYGSVFSLKGDFDIIWMNQAFHHIEPRKQFINFLIEHLNPGGKIIFAESNALNPLIQTALFKVRGFKTIKTIKDEFGNMIPYGDERVISYSNLLKLFPSNLIKKESIRYFQLFPNNPKYKNYEKRLSAFSLPSFLYARYNLVLKKNH